MTGHPGHRKLQSFGNGKTILLAHRRGLWGNKPVVILISLTINILYPLRHIYVSFSVLDFDQFCILNFAFHF